MHEDRNKFCVYGRVSVAWNGAVGQLAAGDDVSVWALGDRSLHREREFLGLLCRI